MGPYQWGLRLWQPRKEGRKYYICSSRLGLIRWDIIQHVKAVHDQTHQCMWE